jgi:HSP20 family molecular chaperone IbpA
METTATKERECAERTPPEQEPASRVYVPAIDIVEHDDELLLLADVPGARAEDIEINVERSVLELHARVERGCPGNEAKRLLCEYGVADYRRSFKLGDGIDAEGVRAEVADGVLTLRLPKSEALKPKRIEVRSGNGSRV